MNKLLLQMAAAMVCVSGGAQIALAQNISVVSGNGQVLSRITVFSQDMVVKVTNASGAPISGATVTWTAQQLGAVGLSGGQFITGTGVGTNQTTTTTDATGVTSTKYAVPTALQVSFYSPVSQTAITAVPGSSSSSVTFTLTQIPPGSTATVTPGISFVVQSQPDTLSGAAGTTGATPFQVSVTASNGGPSAPVPNVAVQFLNVQDPSSGPAIACASSGSQAGLNTALTDSQGMATCYPTFGGRAGTGQAYLTAGGIPSAASTSAGFWQLKLDPSDPNYMPIQTAAIATLPTNFKVTAGAAVGSITIVSGNNQTATPGSALGAPFVAQVKDTNGNAFSGVAVNWSVSPSGAVSFANQTTTSDSSGNVSNTATVASGAAQGTATVTATLASDATKSVAFAVTIGQGGGTVTTSLTIVSGNNQTVSQGGTFAPLVVQVTQNGAAASGVTVTFQANGPVNLSSTTATTNANGQAQVTATAASTQGTATVSAAASGAQTQTFSLTVGPPAPPISANSFVNAADYQLNSFSPCSLGALVASAGVLGNIAVSPTLPGLPVPSTAVKVSVGGINAPVLNIGTNYKGQQMITFQVPCEVTPGSSVATTLTTGGATSTVNLNVQAASPGVFQTINSDGVLRTALVRPDGSFVSLDNPARRGEFEVAFVTGLGPTSPSVGTLAVPVPGAQATVKGTVVVGMHGQGVPLNYARLSEDLPGVYVVSFQIPSDMVTGNDVTFSVALIPQGGTNPIYSATTKVPVN